MEAEAGKISVWVCREEKLVSGLSKRTTCADVTRVLLEEQSVLAGLPARYCIVEKWRGFERVLPHTTRILRLWSAWGDEQENVRFVLVKQEASLPNNGPRSAEARVVASKENPCVYRSTASVTMALSHEKQRRVVRKAFRKLEKMNNSKKRARVSSEDKPASAERMETLVHLIVSQDHTIRQQLRRIHELDREIEQHEAKVHSDRVRALGTNYVQDTYLETHARAAEEQEEEQRCPEERARLEEYSRRCEEVLRLQEELWQHELLLDSVTAEITDELNRRWMERRRDELSCTEPEDHPPGESQLVLGTEKGTAESALLVEEERIRTQLDTSLYVGLRLNTDLEAIKGDLDLARELWAARESELKDLTDRVGTLDLCAEDTLSVEVKVCEPSVNVSDTVCSVKTESAWVEQARGLPKSCDIIDDDSDTGLSSLHSQDSDNPPVCESLV